MVHFGLIELATLKLFLSLSERSKNMVATYFNISYSDLHFSYTHLVCRSPMPGMQKKKIVLMELYCNNKYMILNIENILQGNQ